MPAYSVGLLFLFLGPFLPSRLGGGQHFFRQDIGLCAFFYPDKSVALLTENNLLLPVCLDMCL